MFNENIDLKCAQKAYASNGWVRIPDILQPDFAAEIRQCLLTKVPWELFYLRNRRESDNAADQQKICVSTGAPAEYISCNSEQVDALTAADKTRITDEINARARELFGFNYYKYDLKESNHPVLREFYEGIGSEKYYGFIKYLTGELAINNRNAIATCYSPASFLKQHTDLAPDQNRKVAHIFGFTENWQPHWGGLLHLLDDQRDVSATLIPGFNTLTLFKVPTRHFVSQVASWAPESRYSVTGWFLAPG